MGRQRELLRLSIILCMGLLFVMAGILLIVGKLAGKRLASIAGGVLMIAWGFSAASPNYGRGCSHAPPTWKWAQSS